MDARHLQVAQYEGHIRFASAGQCSRHTECAFLHYRFLPANILDLAWIYPKARTLESALNDQARYRNRRCNVAGCDEHVLGSKRLLQCCFVHRRRPLFFMPTRRVSHH